jgi:hypothetical protein
MVCCMVCVGVCVCVCVCACGYALVYLLALHKVDQAIDGVRISVIQEGEISEVHSQVGNARWVHRMQQLAVVLVATLV